MGPNGLFRVFLSMGKNPGKKWGVSPMDFFFSNPQWIYIIGIVENPVLIYSKIESVLLYNEISERSEYVEIYFL